MDVNMDNTSTPPSPIHDPHAMGQKKIDEWVNRMQATFTFLPNPESLELRWKFAEGLYFELVS